MRRLKDYVQLFRPRVAVLVIVTVAVGAWLGGGGVAPLGVIFHALLGTVLVTAGASALNQLLERDTDALMRRTRDRPLPAGRLAPAEVAALGIGLTAVGLLELALGTNLVAAATAAATHACYVLAYTPLKRRTSLNTLVGAVAGAAPPVIGWAAARGAIDEGALSLFGIVFLWQFPHFLAIAWLHRDDYARAGLKMLPAIEGSDAIGTRMQVPNYAIALVPVSLVPTVAGIAGPVYFFGALALSCVFLGFALGFSLRVSRDGARRLLFASLVYLPVLFGLLMLDRTKA